MNSHDLARRLLELPDLPVATHALNHVYMSKTDRESHGPLRLGTLESYRGQHIVIGDIGRRMVNYPNWWISDVHFGEKVPDHYGRYGRDKEARSEPYPGPTVRGASLWYDKKLGAGEPIEVLLMGDGIDRYSTGDNEGFWALVDARGGPPEPQFGGKWRGQAWRSNEHELLADTGRTFATAREATDALNTMLSVHMRRVVLR